MLEEAVYDTDSAIAVESEELPPHLLPLPVGDWAVWRWVGLRGSGFPSNEVLKLADPDCAAAADRVLESETESVRARGRGIDSLRRALTQDVSPSEHTELENAIRRLQKGKLPQEHNKAGSEVREVDDFRQAVEVVQRARADFFSEFEASAGRTSQIIRDVASDNRFREAIIWQNRHAYQTGLKKLLSSENKSRDSKQRQLEELVATYLQRYSVKNDTIGFFGPAGWARLMPAGDPIQVQTGPDLVRTRNVYFEAWGIDAIAEVLSQNRMLRRWFAPMPMPFVYTDGNTVHVPMQRPLKLTPEQAAVFHRCDGARLARDIALEVVSDPANKVRTEDDVYRQLQALRGRGLIAWSLAVPMPYRQNLEQTLTDFCERIDDDGCRRPVTKLIEELESARQAVKRAAADPDALDKALGAADEFFTRYTNVAATRMAGQMYASRTLLYEDCCRDVDVSLGPEHLEQLGRPLTLLLEGARWFTYQVGVRCREAFSELYDELALKNGSTTLSALDFFNHAQPLLFDSDRRVAKDVLPEFQRRWGEILPLGAERSVEFRSEEIRAAVQDAFSAPRAGWRFARYHSPDVMIAAQDVDAINRGEFQYVLGELHLGFHTMANWIFVGQHPAPEELLRAMASDLPEPRIIFIPPKHWPAVNVRIMTALTNPKDFYLQYSVDPMNSPPSHTLPIGSLIVERRGEELLMRTRDGRLEFELLEMLGEVLSGVGINYFKLLPDRPHTPRITIDRLVVGRETWRFRSSELQFAAEKDRSLRFLAVRRWARSHGMPRFVFVKTPVEVKPFFVDFDSPLYVDIFSKMIRRTANAGELDPILDQKADLLISISEMLPVPDQTWLRDVEQRKYTSEFRIIALDLAR